MKHNDLARPYAKACFELAQASQTFDAWHQVLQQFCDLVAMPELRSVIQSPKVSQAQIQSLLKELTQSLEVSYQNLLMLLCENKRLSVLPELLVIFDDLVAQAQQTICVEMTTAFKADQSEQNQIEKALHARFGHTIELSNTVDSSIIGGAILRSKDWVIDASLTGRLKEMANELMSKG